MAAVVARYSGVLLGMVLAVSVLSSARAEDYSDPFYRMEIGVQGGAGYYVGELAPHVFLSVGEVYGVQGRVKIDPRWAVQVKGQRQRVINSVKEGNEWGVLPGRYQVPMWHFDIVGEYNFFRLGLNQYDIHMRKVSPYIFLGIGMTVHNRVLAGGDVRYPELWIGDDRKMEYAMYLPIGVGVKWKVADRWQLQLAWQHNVYLLNGDGLEGAIVATDPGKFNNSYEMNGSNIMNNDVISGLTLGVVFEFAPKKEACPHCKY